MQSTTLGASKPQTNTTHYSWTSRERTFGKLYNQAPLPSCLSKLRKSKWKTVPGEKLACSRGRWLPPGSRCLPLWAAQRLCGHGCLRRSMFYQAVSSLLTHPPCKHPVGKAVPGPRGQSQCQKGRLSLLPALSSTEKQSTKKKKKRGKPARRGRRESIPQREKKRYINVAINR